MNLSVSYWDLDYYREQDFVIIGGGITGINAAINLKLMNPWKKVLVIDGHWLGGGASSKNAGFVCYGSPTEILGDLQHCGETTATDLIARRWEGAKKTLEMVPHDKMDFKKTGGTEVFDSSDIPDQLTIDGLNAMMKKATDTEQYFQYQKNNISSSFQNVCVYMKEEGRIHPKKMMEYLYQKALHLQVKFITDQVIHLHESSNQIELQNFGTVSFGKCGVTLNGYIKNLLPKSDVKPARNIVMITEDLPEMTWDSVVHYNKGYVYFRRIGQKILLGGGRNLDPVTETTDTISMNETISNYLKSFLLEKLCHGKPIRIEHQYIGILGFGSEKIPKVKTYTKDIIIAAGMGGMGVAIGSQIGKELADSMLQ